MRASAQLATRPSTDEKRLERADARHRLDRAILAQQRSDASAVDAEDGPVRLLADVGARVRARAATAWRCAVKNAFASRRPRRARSAAGCVPASDAHRARLRIREQVVLDVAASALDVAHGPPATSRRRRIASRSATGASRRRGQRTVTRVEARAARRARACRGRRRRARRSVEAGAALAGAAARGDHELDRRGASQRAVGRGTPGERDVALAKPLRLPVAREPVVGPFAHHTLSPLASTSLNCSALGGASPRTLSVNSKRAG